MRLKMVLCLLLCTFGTAAYCDEQAAARTLSSEEKLNEEDPNLLMKPDEASLIPDSPEINDPVFGSTARRQGSREPGKFGSRK